MGSSFYFGFVGGLWYLIVLTHDLRLFVFRFELDSSFFRGIKSHIFNFVSLLNGVQLFKAKRFLAYRQIIHPSVESLKKELSPAGRQKDRKLNYSRNSYRLEKSTLFNCINFKYSVCHAPLES